MRGYRFPPPIKILLLVELALSLTTASTTQSSHDYLFIDFRRKKKKKQGVKRPKSYTPRRIYLSDFMYFRAGFTSFFKGSADIAWRFSRWLVPFAQDDARLISTICRYLLSSFCRKQIVASRSSSAFSSISTVSSRRRSVSVRSYSNRFRSRIESIFLALSPSSTIRNLGNETWANQSITRFLSNVAYIWENAGLWLIDSLEPYLLKFFRVFPDFQRCRAKCHTFRRVGEQQKQRIWSKILSRESSEHKSPYVRFSVSDNKISSHSWSICDVFAAQNADFLRLSSLIFPEMFFWHIKEILHWAKEKKTKSKKHVPSTGTRCRRDIFTSSVIRRS